MDVQSIINQLTQEELLPSTLLQYKSLTGGSSSSVYLLEFQDCNPYVVKLTDPITLKEEADFLAHYADIKFIPSLHYVDPSYQYIVYEFVKGTTEGKGKNKNEMLETLVHSLLNHYRHAPAPNKWGWTDDPVDSWQSFLRSRVEDAHPRLQGVLTEKDSVFIKTILQELEDSSHPYLLHGDCGVHNFIYTDGLLSGVIDPTPVYGSPLYDLIYAFCSCPQDLTEETLEGPFKQLSMMEISKSQLYKEVLVILYIRIATCIHYHPQDLQEYLIGWKYWREKIEK